MQLRSEFGKVGWYPNTKEALIDYIDQTTQKEWTINQPTALICPHAGYRYCGSILGHAMSSISNQLIEHIIVIGPSHYVALKNQWIVPIDASFTTEIGTSHLNSDCLSNISKLDGCLQNNEIFKQEHSIWMMLPFIQHLLPNATISPIIIGNISNDQCKLLAKTIKTHQSKSTLVVISSDFTHYGPNFNYVPFTNDISNKIKQIDKKALGFIQSKDALGFWNWFHNFQTTICGRYAISLLLELLNNDDEILDAKYQQSGELNNEWLNSVSYYGLIIGKESKND